ncbi:MAG TPA: hypothetical protein VMT43_12405 [Acidimicrobiales bacterium]|nr:hypothetical protein [Acidimicrobiales bacterium]
MSRAATQASALRVLLEALGVDAVYGPRGPWEVDVEVDPTVAVALAAAHRRVHGLAAAAHLGDGRFVLGDLSGRDEVTVVLDDASDLVEPARELRDALVSRPRRRIVVVARVDPERAAPALVRPDPLGVDSWTVPDETLVDRVRAAERPMVIAGPGVVDAGAVGDLRALAGAADLGVLNTWGAKGVFDWRSRHHWATVGLQAHDLELGGVVESDLVVLTGIDPDELDMVFLAGRPTLDVSPASLGPLAEQWSRPRGDGAMPELRARLAEVTQAGWGRADAPLAPSQATRTYSELVRAGGFVAADPGLAGYWVARTLGTTRLGGAKVPSRRAERGSAIASVVVSRLRRPRASALAVTDAPLQEIDHLLLDSAQHLGVSVTVEVWDTDGPRLSADEHEARLRGAADLGSTLLPLVTDPSQLDEMVRAAGRVTAWGGLVHELTVGGRADDAGGAPA